MNNNEVISVEEEKALSEAFDTARNVLNKSYLNLIRDSFIVKSGSNLLYDMRYEEDLINTVRLMDITKIVFDKNENQRNKLISVYRAVAESGYSLIFMITGDRKNISIKMGIRSNDGSIPKRSVLEKLIKGNFPGTEIKHIDKNAFKEKIYNCINKEYISIVSGVAGLRFNEENINSQFVQGYEKLIGTLQDDEFTLLLIADPVSSSNLSVSRQSLEEIYSQLFPYSSSGITIGENESQTLNKSITESVRKTISNSIADSVTHTTGSSSTITNGTSEGETLGVSCSKNKSFSLGSFSIGKSKSVNYSTTNTISHSESESLSAQYGYGKNFQRGYADAKGTSVTKSDSVQAGKNRSVQFKFENHSVTQFLKKIDEVLNRYSECADVGMWNCAMYCLSSTPDTAKLASSAYHALMRGKKSSLEAGCITSFDANKANMLLPYLLRLKHPLFSIKDMPPVTAGSLVSSSELAIHASLPLQSVPGVPVIECASFGRDISTYNNTDNNDKIILGSIYHMLHKENLEVALDANSLTSHLFIAGSTGSGKSNAVCQILSEARKQNRKFLIIEPAKGEYKKIFGGFSDVNVYGTNPLFAPLLKLNPFSFDCKHTLVHEHIDRLISIFNVCWPMYAAMPAVMKEAIERSYADAGWDMENPCSENLYNNSFFPSFSDVARNIRIIIDSSDYDTDNKGAYKGSLLTRLNSLTNGINGLIFSPDEIDSAHLFNENTIIDLSRVGSAETKSLIMGILVLKLQEYRMGSEKINEKLNHITVLEEAHHLLKKTISEISLESANITGRSVEMISNAIAEMRTYGECFIITDQAPGMLDMAAIRNTNTKIILRLPDIADRSLVGKAANLNEDQITELAKLPQGVAAVYQNEWVQSVLCKINKFSGGQELNYKPCDAADNNISLRLKIASMISRMERLPKEAALSELSGLNISGAAKSKAMEILTNPPEEMDIITNIAPVISALFPKSYSAVKKIYFNTQANEWTKNIKPFLVSELTEELYNTADIQVIRDIIQSLITQYVYNELHRTEKLKEWSEHSGF